MYPVQNCRPDKPAKASQRRFRLRPGPAALPLVLLLLALATLFLFSGDREYFYRERPLQWHDWNSSKTLAIAKNLSLRHNWLMFFYQSRDAAGNLSYPAPYNRFPAGGFALIKLATLPFGDTDFRAQIYAGRMLMLLLFSAAAVLAYHSLARIAGSRWDALTATLLAFSSYFLLYYADQIFNEITIDLFAVMLAFHGMAIFVQEGRFRQLLVKSCLALLLGWHIYAFLLPFIVFGLAAELLKGRRFYLSSVPGNLKWYAAALLRSRYLTLGIVTLLFGIAILTFNLGNEYFALNGAVPLRELPTVNSAVKRLSGSEGPNEKINWLHPGSFLPDQFYRIAIMTLPYPVNPYPIKGLFPSYRYRDYPAIALGILMVGFCLAGLALAGIRRRPELFLLLATLTFSGFCWSAPLRRNVATHDFESVFYIGIPLTVFMLGLLCLRRLSRSRLAPYLTVAALAVFVFAVSAMARVGETRAAIAVEGEQMDDYAAIRELAQKDAAIYIPYSPYYFRHGGAQWAAMYFLAGKTLVYTDEYGPGKPQQAGDYLLLTTRLDSPALLTPYHRHIFLYDWALYDQWRRTADWGRPIIAQDWQVHLRDGHLTYTSPECANRDATFFLHYIPRHTGDLRADRREYGYDAQDFDFQFGGFTLTDGACVVDRRLPDYDIAAIRTGQYTEAGRIWQGEYRLPSP